MGLNNSYELETVFKPSAGAIVGLSLLDGEGGALIIRYDSEIGRLAVDRDTAPVSECMGIKRNLD